MNETQTETTASSLTLNGLIQRISPGTKFNVGQLRIRCQEEGIPIVPGFNWGNFMRNLARKRIICRTTDSWINRVPSARRRRVTVWQKA